MNGLDGGQEVVDVAARTVALFACTVFLIRAFGARSIASLTPYDFVIVVAVGNLMAAVAVNPALPFLNALVAMTALFGMQWLVDLLTSRSGRADRFVTGQPRLLYYEGFHDATLRRLRLTRSDLLQAMRSHGFSHEEQVLAVVLETNGTLTVIGRPASPKDSAGTLADVQPPLPR